MRVKYETESGDERSVETSGLHRSSHHGLQEVFDEFGPERDRGTDWWRCQEQPWFGIANVLVYGQ